MIHLNIGSNLNSIFGNKFENISTAINFLIELKFKVKKTSNFYETPSYPNKNLPKFLNMGILGTFDKNYNELLKIINLIEKKMGRIKSKKNVKFLINKLGLKSRIEITRLNKNVNIKYD